MKISEKLNSGKINISLEVFPPKTSDTYDKVQDAVDKIGALKPAFISVTYGAGGGTSKNTLKIAKHIKDDLGVDSLAHLTLSLIHIWNQRDHGCKGGKTDGDHRSVPSGCLLYTSTENPGETAQISVVSGEDERAVSAQETGTGLCLCGG